MLLEVTNGVVESSRGVMNAFRGYLMCSRE